MERRQQCPRRAGRFGGHALLPSPPFGLLPPALRRSASNLNPDFAGGPRFAEKHQHRSAKKSFGAEIQNLRRKSQDFARSTWDRRQPISRKNIYPRILRPEKPGQGGFTS